MVDLDRETPNRQMQKVYMGTNVFVVIAICDLVILAWSGFNGVHKTSVSSCSPTEYDARQRLHLLGKLDQ
jgi:hypothetical protein